MTGQVPTKHRFVRCPKCRGVLSESANLFVYKCGGCGTVLQAKKREVPHEDEEQQVTESVPVHENERENISSDKEAQNFHQEETIPLTDHHPVEIIRESIQTEIQVCNEEHPMDAVSSPEISKNHKHSGNRESTLNLEDGCVSRDVDSTVGFSKELKNQENAGSNPETDKDESESNDAESPTRFSVSTPDVDIDECVSEDTLERDEYLPKQIDKHDDKKNENSKEKLHRCVSFSDEEDENETFLELVNEANQKKLDEEFRSHSIFGSSPEDEILEERILDNDHASSHSRASFYNHEHMSSVDTFDNTVSLRDMPESPITRSYYGFHGSGSSCDGTDDQLPDRKFHLSKRTSKIELSSKSRFNQEMHGQNGYFSSSSSGKRQSTHHETNIKTIGHEPIVPFYPLNQGLGYSNGNYSNDEMGMNFHLPNKREFLEVEKIELLKKVRELEDQLKRTNLSQGKQNGSFSRLDENQVHPYYDDYILEATTSSNIYIHTYNNDAIKVRAERLYLGKKHTLPISGGAPFLLCYGCSEVLQVPADFLLFKRRYHKLKCGNCSDILKFSLQNGTQIVYIDHISKDLKQTEPVSIDEAGPSFRKSFSSEKAPSPIELDDMKKNFSEKKLSSSKKGSKFTNFVKNLGYVRTSSKRSKAESSTSESEEVSGSAILLKSDAGF